MDIREQLEQAKSPEEMEEYMLDLDSEFRFKCRRCGKCCKNQDTILFNARDIYNIAKKLGKTTIQVIEECAEVYIGNSSRLPMVHMVPVGRQRRCPLLLDDGRCSVHDCKPTVCALYPLGRVAIFDGVKDADAEITKENIRVKYIINDYTCGSAKKAQYSAQLAGPVPDSGRGRILSPVERGACQSVCGSAEIGKERLF